MPVLPGLFARMMVKALSLNFNQKLEAPEIARPSTSAIDPQIVNRFVEHQRELMAKLKAMETGPGEHCYHITLREVVDLQRPRHGPSVSCARTATLRAGAKSNGHWRIPEVTRTAMNNGMFREISFACSLGELREPARTD
jgi:hypothetical protein